MRATPGHDETTSRHHGPPRDIAQHLPGRKTPQGQHGTLNAKKNQRQHDVPKDVTTRQHNVETIPQTNQTHNREHKALWDTIAQRDTGRHWTCWDTNRETQRHGSNNGRTKHTLVGGAIPRPPPHLRTTCLAHSFEPSSKPCARLRASHLAQPPSHISEFMPPHGGGNLHTSSGVEHNRTSEQPYLKSSGCTATKI